MCIHTLLHTLILSLPHSPALSVCLSCRQNVKAGPRRRQQWRESKKNSDEFSCECRLCVVWHAYAKSKRWFVVAFQFVAVFSSSHIQICSIQISKYEYLMEIWGRYLDKNGDGLISAEDLQKRLTSLGCKVQLQCVAVCVAVCGSVWQCTALFCIKLQCDQCYGVATVNRID